MAAKKKVGAKPARRQKRKATKKKARAKAAKPVRPYQPSPDHTALQIVAGLHEMYPDADCELDWRNPLELLIATILSAQSTDVRVNTVGKTLFDKYTSAADFAAADPEIFQEDIRSTGFFRQKTKNVLKAAQMLVDEHGGEVPQDLDELVKLPGVARKTANVVLGTAFGIPSGVVVDTHVKRLAYRLGLTEQTDPVKVERELMERLPESEWIFAAHAIIWHGRRVCDARKPQCDACDLAPHCPRNGLPLDA